MTNQERDNLIREKLNEGLSLSDVQKLLDSEYGMKMTYFELRMIVSTLDINWSNQEKKHTPAITPADVQEQPKQTPLKEEPPDHLRPPRRTSKKRPIQASWLLVRE